MNVSLTGLGALITILMIVLKHFGIELPDGSDKEIADAIATIAGIVILVYGQLRRNDVTLGLLKK